MRNLNSIALLVFVVLGASTVTPHPARPSQAAPGRLQAAVDAIAAEALKSKAAPGLSIAVGREGRVVLAAGYGTANVELNVAVRPASVFRIGSVTKQFTAAAVMQLVERGEISLDDRLDKFVPEFPVAGRAITVRHLLNHTSGIKSYTGLGFKFWGVSRRDLGHSELLDLIKDEPADFQPGEKFMYNNSGYYLLGMILEKTTGFKYATYMKNRIFEPVGLASTVYCDNEPIIPGRASGYQPAFDGEIRNADMLSMKVPFAAGALCSTATDLVTWTYALAGGKVVKPESYQQMTARTTLNDGTGHPYGFGLANGELAGHRRVSHGGGINGFASSLAHYPDDGVVVAVLVNRGGTKVDAIAENVARAALGVATATVPQARQPR